MSKNFIRLLGLVFALFFSLQSTATQLAIPVTEDIPLRVFLGAEVGTDYSALRLFGGQLGFTHYLGSFFEWGMTLHAAAESPALFQGGAVTPTFGGDFMLRFFGGITDAFYLGVQSQIGYTHYFSADRLNSAGELLLDVGIPLAVGGGDTFWFYFFPSVVLGSKSDADFTANRVWGGLYGLRADVGFAFEVGLPWIFIQATPRFKDWNDFRGTFSTNFMAGLAVNF